MQLPVQEPNVFIRHAAATFLQEPCVIAELAAGEGRNAAYLAQVCVPHLANSVVNQACFKAFAILVYLPAYSKMIVTRISACCQYCRMTTRMVQSIGRAHLHAACMGSYHMPLATKLASRHGYHAWLHCASWLHFVDKSSTRDLCSKATSCMQWTSHKLAWIRHGNLLSSTVQKQAAGCIPT